jgi:hypothetical protein
MYLEIDEGFPGHRKTLKLCSLLGDPQAGWYMIRLWTWACRSCKSGDLHGMSPTDIEMAVQYRPLDGSCYKAMAAAGYIDESKPGEPAAIHGWADHTGGAIARMEAKAIENRQRRAEAKARHDAKNGKAQTGDIPEPYQNRTGMIISKTRQDKTSQDKSSDSPLLLASGSGSRVATGGPIQPDTVHNLIHCLKVAMEAARPARGMYAPGPFADRDAGELLRALGGECAAPEVAKRIALFVADDSMTPWTVARFCKVYNGIGAPKAQDTGQPKQAVYR